MMRRFIQRSHPMRLLPTPTTSGASIRYCSSAKLSNEDIIAKSNWKSGNDFDRLGLPRNMTDPEIVKHHYRVLAAHYHPDNTATGQAAAFVDIKESFERLQGGSSSASSSGSSGPGGWGRGWTPRDANERSATSRVYGDGVPVFLVGSFLLLCIIYFHNKHRLGHGYMSHLLAIFLILQFFPRVFAAGILFGWHCSDLRKLYVSEAQHKSVVQLERRKGKQQGTEDVTLSVVGISLEDMRECVVQVTVEDRSVANEVTQRTLAAAKGAGNITVPNLRPGSSLHFKAVQDNKKLLLTDVVFVV